MEKKFLVILAVVLIMGTAYWVVYAFVEPVNSPPAGNVPAPINVGPAAQTKAGDLTVSNLTVNEGLTLGGVRRTEWPEAAAGCNWEGTKCACVGETASVGSVKLTIGMTCENGQLTDFKIMQLDVSSRRKRCGDAPPPGCSAGLYVKQNQYSSATSL